MILPLPRRTVDFGLPQRREIPAPARHFNVVELVLVLTVLLSLISLVVPALYRGGLQAKSLLCSSNQGRLGTWISMYSYDSQGLAPPYELGWVTRVGAIGGREVAQDEKPEREFACPSQSFESPVNGVTPAAYWRGTYFGISEHLCSTLHGVYGDPLPQWALANLRDIKDPTRKLILADASGLNYFGVPGRDPVIAGLSQEGLTYADSLPPQPAKPFPFLRHVDGSGNFLFLDGHVEVRTSWPVFMTGPGTSGYEFWHAEHWYPGSGFEKPETRGED